MTFLSAIITTGWIFHPKMCELLLNIEWHIMEDLVVASSQVLQKSVRFGHHFSAYLAFGVRGQASLTQELSSDVCVSQVLFVHGEVFESSVAVLVCA